MAPALETWNNKIRALCVKGMPRAQAAKKVSDENPQLRQLVISEANSGTREKPIAALTARLKAANNPKALTSSVEFRKQVEAMVAEGWKKADAIRELSRAMGLSKPPETGIYFDRVRQHYRGR